MTKDEALRLALEALENITSVSICEATHHAKKDRHLLCEECPNEVRHLKAITAIKAALEAKDEAVVWNEGVPAMLPKQKEGETFIVSYEPKLEAKDEPVVNTDHVICPNCVHQFRAIPQNVQKLMLASGFEPPFTTPTQRKPLTDEEIERIWESLPFCNGAWETFARAIEAAHGIKGEA